MCDKNGVFKEHMKKTTFLWIVNEEKNRVSPDRLLRFMRGKQEIKIDRVVTHDAVYKDLCLTFGDITAFRVTHSNDLCVIGQVINFENEGNTKSQRNFPYSFCIFEINKNAWIKLSPCFMISKRGALTESNHKSFHVSSYIASLKSDSFNFKSTIVSRLILRELKKFL